MRKTSASALFQSAAIPESSAIYPIPPIGQNPAWRLQQFGSSDTFDPSTNVTRGGRSMGGRRVRNA
jgi:hypothetical protein